MPAPAMRYGGEWLRDPNLREHATERQRQFMDAVIKHGTMHKAAEALKVRPSVISESLKCARERAAAMGHAPGHFNDGVPAGFRMGKVTIGRAHLADGSSVVERTWERVHPEHEQLIARIRQTVEALKDDIPFAAPVPAPLAAVADLCTQYTVTDYHFGELSHASEGDSRGADWNLPIAEDMLVAAIADLAGKSPDSDTAVLALLGDLLHFDGPDAVTLTNKHPLDAAGRQRTMVRVVVRAIRRVVALLLAKHRFLMIVVVEGNHDIAGTPWLQEILMTHYENEPRVQISDNDLPFFAWQFGCNFLGFHHGHKKAKEKLPGLFAAMFRPIWGATTKGYIHCGHYHEVDEKEYPGVRIIQHPTISAPGSHALRGGWISEREMTALHYHAKFGLRGRDTVTPEMLAA